MSSQPDQAGSSNPFGTYIEEFQERTPSITKFLIISLIITYLISWIFATDEYFADIPYYTYFNFELYRLILSPWVGNSLILLIVGIIFLVGIGYKSENGQGSLHFLYDISLILLVTNISFGLLCIILYIGGQSSALLWSCAGIWYICFGLVTIECMQVYILITYTST